MANGFCNRISDGRTSDKRSSDVQPAALTGNTGVDRSVFAMKTLPLSQHQYGACFGRRLRALVCGGFGLVGVVAWQPLSAQVLLLNDSFPNGGRGAGDQNPPSSAYWYAGGGFSAASGSLSQTGGLAQNFVANFTSGTGSSQSLNVGDAITLSFTFGVTGAFDTSSGAFSRGFRVGLLNSNGAAYIDAGLHDSYYNGFTGYFAALNLNTSSLSDNAPIALIKRSGTDGTAPIAPATSGNSFLILNNALGNLGTNGIGTGTSSNPYNTLGTGGSISTLNLIQGTTYTGALTLFRDTTSSMILNLSVNGGTLSGYSATVPDPSSIFSAFNTIAIGPATGALTTFTLQNASVIYTAVPEPSTYAVIAGAFALVGAAIFRRCVALG
jgi:hypothetical protein